ncbi:MAG: Choline-sulfatase [Planctomycetes bacterium ADurb.Bin126]|nr:MAG: Choline-sulfatase [Planctomycetes bacterium ADurb.Bin126]HOD84572.1 arylsulfatase [Phycisphaerae bacterium]HQL75260.1 arylsulfatase [Phycisphaerae bacterium]
MKHVLATLAGLIVVLAAAPVIAAPSDPASATKPNILLVLTDDIGWGDYGCYDPKGKIPSPNIDRLAREGMRFTNAHTPAGLCAPTRYTMLTGNYPWRGRSPGGTWGYNVPSQLRPGQRTVADLLRGAGYRTAMYGKAGTGGFWQAAKGPKPHAPLAPIEWGFDYSFLIPRGHQSPPHAFFENGVEVPMQWDTSLVGQRLLDKANRFLDDHLAANKSEGRERPFYMHVCTDGSHSPYVPAPFLGGVPLKGATKMTAHTDMVYETDILAGQLVEALQRRGLLDNTLLVITSDNGGLPYERNYGHDAVAGLRGRKGFIFEGGHRVPFIVRWPGKVQAGSVRNQVIGTHDLVATALELAGVKAGDKQCLDAVSLLPVLLGKQDDAQPIRESLLVQSSPGRDANDDGGFTGGDVEIDEESGVKASHKADKKPRLAKNAASDHMAHAILAGEWKLLIDMANRPAALYHLSDDPSEQKNLISDPAQAERVKHMNETYRTIRASRRSTPIP